MKPDCELLRHYAVTNSEEAFAELVRRHVNLVHSAALRQVNGDVHLAHDIAQTVFASLARQARSLSHRETLTGWLYTSAHFAAAKIVRGESRRRHREENFMRDPLSENAPDPDWEKLRPVLDDAMHQLKETDREALLLRYFENRQFAEVGAKLGLNENAARMRVERSLEKLRAILAKRGLTTTALASAISAHAVQTAPAGLAATLSTAAITAAGTGTFTLLKIMTATKLKLAATTLVIAGAATALVVQNQAQEKLRADNRALTQQIVQMQTDSENLSNRLAAAGASNRLPDAQLNELLKLRGEVGVLRGQLGDLEKVRTEESDANRRARTAELNLATALSVQAQFNAHQSATINAMKQLGLAMRVYAGNHDNQYPTNVAQLTNDHELDSFYIGGIDLGAFDFMNAGLPGGNPQMLELRERLARQAPDGSWNRIYGFADGSVQSANSIDGNFDAWEKQNTYTPPANQ